MFNVRLAGGHLYGKQLSLVVSLMASFVLSFFPLDVLNEIWDLIESVSEGFLTYSFTSFRLYPLTRGLGFLYLYLRSIFFLPKTLKIIKYNSSFLFIYDILHRISAFYERHLVFFVIAHERSLPKLRNLTSLLTPRVSCLSKTDFSSTAKNRTNFIPCVRIFFSHTRR